MKNFARWLRVLALASSVGACGLLGPRTTFQSVEISNAGTSAISGVSLAYGDNQIILGRADSKIPAGHPGLNTISQGFDGAIPDKAFAGWQTDDDGVWHQATIPTHDLIKDPSMFYGFRFWVVDAHVDVYLIERQPNAKRLSLKYTKVFTST